MATAEKIVGYKFGPNFYADIRNHVVLCDGKPLAVPLTLKQFEVLEFFLKRPGQLIERDSIRPIKQPPRGRHPIDNYLSEIAGKLDIDMNELFPATRRIGYTLVAKVLPIVASDYQ